MNLESIVQAMFTRQSETSSRYLVPHTPEQHIVEGDFHITHDGKLDNITADSLKIPPLQFYILDSDRDDEDLFDTSSVSDPNFNAQAAINGTSPYWKLMEVIVQADGLIVFNFMDTDPEHYDLDTDGAVIVDFHEIVSINASVEHLLMIIESENGHRQFVIRQELSSVSQHSDTSITEISEGVKISRLSSDGSTDDSGNFEWYKTIYDTQSPQHYWHRSTPRTDQPGV